MDSEESFRRVAADSMAQGFILEYLLRRAWLELPRQDRLNEAKALLEGSIQTDQFSGATKGDEAAAEQLADVVLRFQENLDGYVGRALHFCAEEEERKWAKGD